MAVLTAALMAAVDPAVVAVVVSRVAVAARVRAVSVAATEVGSLAVDAVDGLDVEVGKKEGMGPTVLGVAWVDQMAAEEAMVLPMVAVAHVAAHLAGMAYGVEAVACRVAGAAGVALAGEAVQER